MEPPRDAMHSRKLLPPDVWAIGVSEEAANELAPRTQISPYAFESCLALATVNFAVSKDPPSRAHASLKSLCGSRIEHLQLPPDFNFLGPMACENCKHLVHVDLMRRYQFHMGVHFFVLRAPCGHLATAKVFRRIGKEAFLSCASLREVYIPPALHYFAHRALFGREQLTRLIKIDEPSTWRGPYAESNAFMLRERFRCPSWIKMLSPDDFFFARVEALCAPRGTSHLD